MHHTKLLILPLSLHPARYHVHPLALAALCVSLSIFSLSLSIPLNPFFLLLRVPLYAVFIRPQSLKLDARVISMSKKLQSRSQSLALHPPARSLPRASHAILAGAITSASMLLLLKDPALCQPAVCVSRWLHSALSMDL